MKCFQSDTDGTQTWGRDKLAQDSSEATMKIGSTDSKQKEGNQKQRIGTKWRAVLKRRSFGIVSR
jgi:hypothetical protein